MEDNILRVRLTPELIADIEDQARRLKIKPHEVARMALAAGMVALFGEQDSQPNARAA